MPTRRTALLVALPCAVSAFSPAASVTGVRRPVHPTLSVVAWHRGADEKVEALTKELSDVKAQLSELQQMKSTVAPPPVVHSASPPVVTDFSLPHQPVAVPAEVADAAHFESLMFIVFVGVAVGVLNFMDTSALRDRASNAVKSMSHAAQCKVDEGIHAVRGEAKGLASSARGGADGLASSFQSKVGLMRGRATEIVDLFKSKFDEEYQRASGQTHSPPPQSQYNAQQQPTYSQYSTPPQHAPPQHAPPQHAPPQHAQYQGQYPGAAPTTPLKSAPDIFKDGLDNLIKSPMGWMPEEMKSQMKDPMSWLPKDLLGSLQAKGQPPQPAQPAQPPQPAQPAQPTAEAYYAQMQNTYAPQPPQYTQPVAAPPQQYKQPYAAAPPQYNTPPAANPAAYAPPAAEQMPPPGTWMPPAQAAEQIRQRQDAVLAQYGEPAPPTGEAQQAAPAIQVGPAAEQIRTQQYGDAPTGRGMPAPAGRRAEPQAAAPATYEDYMRSRGAQ